MAEKRSIDRIRKRMQLRYGKDAFSHLGFTDDISPGGLFIRTTLVYPPGSILQVQIAHTATPIELSGVVMWARKVPPNLASRVKGGMGIRIIQFQTGEEDYRSLAAAR